MTGYNWLRKGLKMVSCKYSKEPSGSIKAGNFLTR
jgi:hypothetical protein